MPDRHIGHAQVTNAVPHPLTAALHREARLTGSSSGKENRTDRGDLRAGLATVCEMRLRSIVGWKWCAGRCPRRGTVRILGLGQSHVTGEGRPPGGGVGCAQPVTESLPVVAGSQGMLGSRRL